MNRLIYICFFALWACSETPQAGAPAEPTAPSPAIRAKSLPEFSAMYTGVDNLRLRAQPSTDGTEVARLPESTMVQPTGAISEIETKLTLRGLEYHEPWIEIQTGQLKGWVFAGALDFDPGTSQLNKRLFENRCKNLFGDQLYQDIVEYKAQTENITSAQELKAALQTCEKLKAQLNPVLERKATFNSVFPKLMWLDKGVPGLQNRPVAEGTKLQLFLDYRDWKAWASKTENAADDSFVQFLDDLNGIKGVEGNSPNYFTQTWDYGGSSRLGEGIHFKLLKQADILHTDQTLFSPLVIPYAKGILNDILTPTNKYWNKLGPIDTEMSQIISELWSVIDKTELSALEKRKDEFLNFEQNGIKLNEKGI